MVYLFTLKFIVQLDTLFYVTSKNSHCTGSGTDTNCDNAGYVEEFPSDSHNNGINDADIDSEETGYVHVLSQFISSRDIPHRSPQNLEHFCYLKFSPLSAMRWRR